MKARAAQTRRSSEVAKACRIETDAPQAIQVDLHESQQSTHPNKLGAAIAAFLRKSPPVCAATRAFDAASTMKPSEVGKKCRRAALAANASKAEHAATAAGLQATGEGKMSGRTFGVQSLR